MLFDGRAVRVGSPREARALGIGMVFQHFCLFEAMTVSRTSRSAWTIRRPGASWRRGCAR